MNGVRSSICVLGCVLNTAVVAILFTVGMSHICCAQQFFEVQNAKQQQWPQEEAEQIYLVATRTVQREFRLSSPVRPRFTLILGANENAADLAKDELKLAQWDKAFFAEGVVLMTLDQMVTPEAKKDLARHALSEAEASVSIAKLRHKR